MERGSVCSCFVEYCRMPAGAAIVAGLAARVTAGTRPSGVLEEPAPQGPCSAAQPPMPGGRCDLLSAILAGESRRLAARADTGHGRLDNWKGRGSR
jgi:hypothetical protein